MSGFFFCGIKLEPVENASPNSISPNSRVLQMIKSSLNRERCMPIMARQKGTRTRNPDRPRRRCCSGSRAKNRVRARYVRDQGQLPTQRARRNRAGEHLFIETFSVAFKCLHLPQQV